MLISPFYPSTQRITKHRAHLYTGIRVWEASNHTIVLTDYARRDPPPIENYRLQITNYIKVHAGCGEREGTNSLL